MKLFSAGGITTEQEQTGTGTLGKLGVLLLARRLTRESRMRMMMATTGMTMMTMMIGAMMMTMMIGTMMMMTMMMTMIGDVEDGVIEM